MFPFSLNNRPPERPELAPTPMGEKPAYATVLLTSELSTEREDAAWKLANEPCPQELAALRYALHHDKSADVKAACIRALSTNQDPEALLLIADVLASNQKKLQSTLPSTEELFEDETLPPLPALIHEGLKAIPRFGTEHASAFSKVLKKLLRHSNPAIQIATIETISELASRNTGENKALAQIFASTRKELIKHAFSHNFYNGRNFPVTRAAQNCLAMVDPAGAIDLYRSTLLEGKPKRHTEAINALRAIALDHPSNEISLAAQEVLKLGLKSYDPHTRRSSAQSLGDVGDYTVISDLLELIYSPQEKEDVKRFAAFSVGDITLRIPIPDEIAAELIRQLEIANRVSLPDTDANPHLATYSLQTLAYLAHKSNPQLLIQTTLNNIACNESGVTAIEILGKLPAHAKPIAIGLREHLFSGNYPTVYRAIRAYRALGAAAQVPEAIEDLSIFLGENTPIHYRPKFASTMTNERNLLHMQALSALAEIGGSDALRVVVVSKLQFTDETVRGWAEGVEAKLLTKSYEDDSDE